MSDAFMKPGEPVAFEGMNFRRAYRERQAGQLYLVQFEVTKEFWDACEVIPREGIVVGAMSWIEEHYQQEEKPAKEKKEKKPKGPHGKYWNHLIGKSGIFNNLDFLATLEVLFPGVDPEQAVRDHFGVASRSFISPEQFEEWLNSLGLVGLVNMSRQAAIKSQGATV